MDYKKPCPLTFTWPPKINLSDEYHPTRLGNLIMVYLGSRVQSGQRGPQCSGFPAYILRSTLVGRGAA
jgi:hypothetical protein